MLEGSRPLPPRCGANKRMMKPSSCAQTNSLSLSLSCRPCALLLEWFTKHPPFVWCAQVRLGQVEDQIAGGSIYAPQPEALVSADIDGLPAAKSRQLDVFLVAEVRSCCSAAPPASDVGVVIGMAPPDTDPPPPPPLLLLLPQQPRRTPQETSSRLHGAFLSTSRTLRSRPSLAGTPRSPLSVRLAAFSNARTVPSPERLLKCWSSGRLRKDTSIENLQPCMSLHVPAGERTAVEFCLRFLGPNQPPLRQSSPHQARSMPTWSLASTSRATSTTSSRGLLLVLAPTPPSAPPPSGSVPLAPLPPFHLPPVVGCFCLLMAPCLPLRLSSVNHQECARDVKACPVPNATSAGRIEVGEPIAGSVEPYNGGFLYRSYQMPYR